MENWAWILWSVLGVILIIAEIFTLGFVLFWFGLGAFAAALIGFLGFGFAVQFIVFAAVSTALTIMSRTIFVNYLSNDEENSVKIG
jgi:membrane protein implicated in regulation of membrane protease activity